MNQWIQSQKLNNQLLNTTILSTDSTDHQDETLIPANAYVEFAEKDDDLEQTLTNGDTSMPDDIASSSLQSPCDRTVDQILLDPSSGNQQEQREQQSTSESSNVTEVSGEQITVDELKKAPDASEAAKLIEEIRTPGFLLEDRHIDAFIAVVQSELQYSDWDMKTPCAVQSIEHYDRKPEEARIDDIQILFEGQAGPDHTGHYICIHYKADNRKVYVYDSLHRRCLSPNSQEIIQRRFPELIEPINFVEPKTQQRDSSSCGVLAAAYATTILLGQNPAKYPLLLKSGPNQKRTSLLRNHLAKIIEKKKLSSFPRAEATEKLGINQNMSPRVLIERLKLPIQSNNCKSPMLSQDEDQMTNICDQSNGLQNSVAIMLDDAYEEFENIADHEQTLTNGKRKINRSNARGNLKKKIKLNTANLTKNWDCHICLYSTKRKDLLKKHLTTHDDVRPHECTYCAKRFKRNTHLRSHMKTHSHLFDFQCSKCRLGFSDENECELHKRECRAEEHECDICKKIFRRKRDIINHMLKHTGKKPCCSICKKRFSTEYNLKRHMKTHKDLFGFHCKKCRQGFEHKKECKFHEDRCQTKQYECYVCKINFFDRKHNLLQHMRLKHVSGTQFICTNMCCQKPFNTNFESKNCPICRKRGD